MPFDQKLASGDTDSVPWAVGEELQASLDFPITVVDSRFAFRAAVRDGVASVGIFRPDVTDRFGKNRWRCTESIPRAVFEAIARQALTPNHVRTGWLIGALLWVVPYRVLEGVLILLGRLRKS